MDPATQRELVELLRGRGIAALGTIFGGAPLVSIVLYAPAPDLSALFIHVSDLAQHTAALLGDRRVGLLIAEPDRPSRNPLGMARVSIQGIADPLEPGTDAYELARAAYINAHPTAAHNFELGGFHLVQITTHFGSLRRRFRQDHRHRWRGMGRVGRGMKPPIKGCLRPNLSLNLAPNPLPNRNLTLNLNLNLTLNPNLSRDVSRLVRGEGKQERE